MLVVTISHLIASYCRRRRSRTLQKVLFRACLQNRAKDDLIRQSLDTFCDESVHWLDGPYNLII